MNATEFRQRVEDLHLDVATGDAHPHAVTSALSDLLSEARHAERQATCTHEHAVSGPVGDHTVTRCPVCGHTTSTSAAR